MDNVGAVTHEETELHPEGAQTTTKVMLDGQRRMWTIGDYPAVARRLRPTSTEVVDALGISEGARVLDVGVGDGNTAIEAARRGAAVTGVDLTPAQLRKARRRAAEAGVDLVLHEANAEALPLADDSFDAVASTFGVIFAPDHSRAAAELCRVCRPGGQVAITAWVRSGWFAIWRERTEGLLPDPPPGSPDPHAWGDPGEMEARLRAAGFDVHVEVRPFSWTFPTMQDGLDFFLTNAGPFVAFMEATRAAGCADQALARLRATLEEANRSSDGTVELDAPYLLALGRK